MDLDLTSLKSSTSSLTRAANVYQKIRMDTEDENSDLMQTLRAGVIQNFEFTYEVSWKFMKRWLEKNIGATAVDGVTRRELFRLAAEHKLINDVEKWMQFHDARNRASHTYDENIAGDVFVFAVDFVNYAKDLLAVLEKKNT